MKLDNAERLELTRKLFLFRAELAYDAWADKEFLARLDAGGRETGEEELWRDYEQEIERQWPAYRDYAMHNYSDGELRTFVAAYWEVANERMRYEEALERRGPSAAAAYRSVLADYRMRAQQAIPANENDAESARSSAMTDSRDDRPVDGHVANFRGGDVEPPGGEGVSPAVHDTTRNLVESIMLDMWPRRGAIVDFGLKSQEHYEALYYPIREGEITPEQLDAALGKGDALTALARSARSNPHGEVTFRTDWDELPPEPRRFSDDGTSDLEFSDGEMEAFLDAVFEGGFNNPRRPGHEMRPGPEETPQERVERQIGHIKLIPDPHDFSIEELGPWDSGVSEEWTRLLEAEKLDRLASQVDWRDISPENKRRLLEREVNFERVSVQAQQQILGEVWHQSAARQYASPGGVTEGRDGPESPGTEPETTRYFGYRTEDGLAVFKEAKDGQTALLAMRNDLRNRSPTGPEWGYSGSGPAQLALAILSDAVGDQEALSCYQDFKFSVVCALPHDHWELRRDEVRAWHAHHRSKSEGGDVVLRESCRPDRSGTDRRTRRGQTS